MRRPVSKRWMEERLEMQKFDSSRMLMQNEMLKNLDSHGCGWNGHMALRTDGVDCCTKTYHCHQKCCFWILFSWHFAWFWFSSWSITLTNVLKLSFYFSMKPAGLKSSAWAAFTLAPLNASLSFSGVSTPVLFSILFRALCFCHGAEQDPLISWVWSNTTILFFLTLKQ